jgi:hypothetical protein
MNPSISAFDNAHHLGETATRPIARFSSWLATLLLLAGQLENRTLWRVQLRFLG